jgi:hypothetical protein
MCKWYIGLFSGYEQISLLSVLNFRMIAYNKNEIDFITCDHNKSVIQYICILCNLPFSIDKEISSKQNIIQELSFKKKMYDEAQILYSSTNSISQK